MSKPIRHRGKWRIRWLDENGCRQSEVHDDHREAEFRLAQHQARVEEIRRGLRPASPPVRTVGDALDYWLANRAPLKRSRQDDASIIARHLRPAFGHLRLAELGVQHTDAFVRVKAEHLAPKTVHNVLTLLIAVLNAAAELGWLVSVPKIKKPRIRLFNREYRYLKTQGEIRCFLRAAAEVGQHVHAMYATAVFTGMRAGELAGLRWADVDLDRRLIVVQRSFNGPTKADDLRYVPILDASQRSTVTSCVPTRLDFGLREDAKSCTNLTVGRAGPGWST